MMDRERIAKRIAKLGAEKILGDAADEMQRRRERIEELEAKMLGMVSETYLAEQLQYGADCIAIRDTEIGRLKGELANARTINRTLDNQLNASVPRAEVEAEVLDLQVELAKARERIEELEAAYDERGDCIDKLEGELYWSSCDAHTMADRIALLEMVLADAPDLADMDVLVFQINNLSRFLAEARERIVELKAENERLRGELAEHLGLRIEDLELHLKYGDGTYLQVASDRVKQMKRQWEKRIAELEGEDANRSPGD